QSPLTDMPYSPPMAEPKDAAAVRVFPPAVPLLTILLGVGLKHLWPIPLGFELPAPARYGVGGLIVLLAIPGLGYWAIRTMRGSGQSENPWKPTTEILDRGPYGFSCS